MESESEYEAAMKLVGSWGHWQKLLKCKPFMDGSDESALWNGLKFWRNEKLVQDQALAYNQLKISAAQGNVTAQKIILEGDKKTSKRGRPSDAEVKKAAAAQAEKSTQVKNDLARIKDLDVKRFATSN